MSEGISSFLADARRLRDENGWGSRKIGDALGIGKDAALRLLRKLELEDARKGQSSALTVIPPAAGLPSLSFYDQARQALAQAKTLAEVKDIADKADGIREFARRAKDRQLEIDAAEMRIRAEYEYGKRLLHVKQTTGFAKGGQPYQEKFTGPDLEPVEKAPTLADLGADKKLSARAQKLGSISQRAMEARVANWRQNAERGAERVSADILKQKSGDTPRARGRAESDDSLDFFPTPPFATRALMERVLPRLGMHPQGHAERRIWEPACGEGHMAGVLSEYSERVFASDIHDYGQVGIQDFLTAEAKPGAFEWIVSNPPFKDGRAEAFVLRALDLAYQGVAMFVALQFLESIGRYEQIFKDRPPTLIAFFAERVPICKGRWDPDASSDAAYVWLVWMKDHAPQPPMWIPPGCRQQLTKPDDRERFAAWSMPKAEAAE